jgi:hypothetical protein
MQKASGCTNGVFDARQMLEILGKRALDIKAKRKLHF